MWYRNYYNVCLLLASMVFGCLGVVQGQNSTGVLVRPDSTTLKLTSPDPLKGEAILAVTTDPLDLWLWENGSWYLVADLRTTQRLWAEDGDGTISYPSRIDVQNIGVSSILNKYIINDNGTFGSVNTIPSTDITGLEQYENLWSLSSNDELFTYKYTGFNTNNPTTFITIGGTTVNSGNAITFGKRIASAEGALPSIGHDSFNGTASDLGFFTGSSSGGFNFNSATGLVARISRLGDLNLEGDITSTNLLNFKFIETDTNGTLTGKNSITTADISDYEGNYWTSVNGALSYLKFDNVISIQSSNSSSGRASFDFDSGDYRWFAGINSRNEGDNFFRIRDITSDNRNAFVVDTLGQAGVGVNPTEMLDVAGTARLRDLTSGYAKTSATGVFSSSPTIPASDVSGLTFINYATDQSIAFSQKQRALRNLGFHSTTELDSQHDLDTETRPLIYQFGSSLNWINKPRAGYFNLQTIRPRDDFKAVSQFAYEFHSGQDIFYRSSDAAGTYSVWSKLWTDRNDGTGSSLDADLLDGLDSGYLLSLANATGSLPATQVSLDASNFDEIGTTYTDVQSAIQAINDYLGTNISVTLTDGQIAFGDSNNEMTSNNNFTYDANSSGIYHQGVGTGVFYQQTNNSNNVIMRYGVTSIEGYIGTLLDDPMQIRQSGSPRITLTDDSKIQFNDFTTKGYVVNDKDGNLSTRVDSTAYINVVSGSSDIFGIGGRRYIIFDTNTESDYQITRFIGAELDDVVTFINKSNQPIEFVPNSSPVSSVIIRFRTLDDDILTLESDESVTFKILQNGAALEGRLVSTTGRQKKGLPRAESNFFDVGAITTNQATLGFDFQLNPDKTGIICQCDDAADSILGMPDLGDGRVVTLHNSGLMACLLVGESAGATDVEFGGGNSTLGAKRSKKLQQHGEGSAAYWSLFTE